MCSGMRTRPSDLEGGGVSRRTERCGCAGAALRRRRTVWHGPTGLLRHRRTGWSVGRGCMWRNVQVARAASRVMRAFACETRRECSGCRPENCARVFVAAAQAGGWTAGLYGLPRLRRAAPALTPSALPHVPMPARASTPPFPAPGPPAERPIKTDAGAATPPDTDDTSTAWHARRTVAAGVAAWSSERQACGHGGMCTPSLLHVSRCCCAGWRCSCCRTGASP